MEDKSNKVTIVVNLQPSKTVYEKVKHEVGSFVRLWTGIIITVFIIGWIAVRCSS